MSTFLLVHGAWHGGWCWRDLAPLLRNAGYDVYTPTLSGLADRGHLLDRSVNLDTHIQDVTGLLSFYDLRDVTLVGHSYGGAVISGVAERADTRIKRLVFLDAIVLRDGEPIIPLGLQDSHRLAVAAQEHGDGWLIPVPARASDGSLFGVKDPETVEWMEQRLTPHPLSTFQHPLEIRSPGAAAIPKAYIYCSAPDSSLASYAQRAKRAGWDYFEIETGHDAMVTEPGKLAQILLGLG